VKVTRKSVKPLVKKESATDRQERLSGWRQDRVEQGRALILGAGALGNEVIKNLSLMGLGYMFVADLDQIEISNLSRAVYFRKTDAQHHSYKAEVVARRAQAMNVTSTAYNQAFSQDIVWELGGGVFRRVDVVLGCLDNVEARLHANKLCLLTRTPYIDGGIKGLTGNVTAVQAPDTACWECNTSSADRDNARSRYDSCFNVMRRDIAAGRLPTVQIASTIIAGLQSQEAMKVIQGQTWAAGHMIQYYATTRKPDFDVVKISLRSDCLCRSLKSYDEVLELPLSADSNTAQDL
jgi:adenylyltransferase/sulfurtransferase